MASQRVDDHRVHFGQVVEMAHQTPAPAATASDFLSRFVPFKHKRSGSSSSSASGGFFRPMHRSGGDNASKSGSSSPVDVHPTPILKTSRPSTPLQDPRSGVTRANSPFHDEASDLEELDGSISVGCSQGVNNVRDVEPRPGSARSGTIRRPPRMASELPLNTTLNGHQKASALELQLADIPQVSYNEKLGPIEQQIRLNDMKWLRKEMAGSAERSFEPGSVPVPRDMPTEDSNYDGNSSVDSSSLAALDDSRELSSATYGTSPSASPESKPQPCTYITLDEAQRRQGAKQIAQRGQESAEAEHIKVSGRPVRFPPTNPFAVAAEREIFDDSNTPVQFKNDLQSYNMVSAEQTGMKHHGVSEQTGPMHNGVSEQTDMKYHGVSEQTDMMHHGVSEQTDMMHHGVSKQTDMMHHGVSEQTDMMHHGVSEQTDMMHHGVSQSGEPGLKTSTSMKFRGYVMPRKTDAPVETVTQMVTRSNEAPRTAHSRSGSGSISRTLENGAQFLKRILGRDDVGALDESFTSTESGESCITGRPLLLMENGDTRKYRGASARRRKDDVGEESRVRDHADAEMRGHVDAGANVRGHADASTHVHTQNQLEKHPSRVSFKPETPPKDKDDIVSRMAEYPDPKSHAKEVRHAQRPEPRESSESSRPSESLTEKAPRSANTLDVYGPLDVRVSNVFSLEEELSPILSGAAPPVSKVQKHRSQRVRPKQRQSQARERKEAPAPIVPLGAFREARVGYELRIRQLEGIVAQMQLERKQSFSCMYCGREQLYRE